MNLARSVSPLALLFASSAVFAATPPAGGAASGVSRSAPTFAVTKLTAAETAKVQARKPITVPRAHSEDQVDGPSLVARVPKTVDPKAAGAVKPRLNVAKFGQTVHAAFKDNVRGYALGLRKNGQPVLTLMWDYGRMPLDGGKGWTLDTRMHVASVSKLMTAITTVKMLDERGISLDSSIAPYLPSYWTVGPNAGDITFRALLTHRAGFREHGGDFGTFKGQIQAGVPSNPADGIGYTNGTFSLVRVLNATMTNAVPRNTRFEAPGLPKSAAAAINDVMWDVKSSEAFVAYAQSKVFTPSGVSNVSAEPTSTSAYAYSGKTDIKGWNSGDLLGQIGGAGFRLSVNDVLDVMHTFRRKGTIVSPAKANAAIESRLGIDQAIDTPAGKIYNKNGLWRNGTQTASDFEQSVAYFLPEDMELVVLVNSQIGAQNASLRGTITDAYVASLE